MTGLSDPGGPKSAATGEIWAGLVPELACLDLARSLAFWCDTLGFLVRYDRPGFAFLRLERNEVMLEQAGGHWSTGPLEPPLGRGINFQMEVIDVQEIVERIAVAGITPFRPLTTRWYRVDDVEYGQSEVLVTDPDGYLLRFMQHLGARSAGKDA